MTIVFFQRANINQDELIANVENDKSANKVNFIGKKSRKKYESDESESDDD